MTKYLISGAALLAFASTAQAQTATPFSGPYVGVQVGYADLEDVHDDLDYWYDNYKNYRQDDGGLIGGIRVGYDKQIGRGVVVGLLGEVSLTDLNTVAPANPDDDTYEIGAKISRLGSVRAKLGYTSGNLAIYGTAGVGFANIKHHMMDIDGSDERFNEKGNRDGLVFGVGAALNMGGRSSIGFDISQYDFGSRTHEVLESDGGSTDYFFKQDDRVRTAMINYSFGF
ncbi:MAG: porin family protein [Sphingomonas bacterium]|nr:porin family protein [Sphingomonas bacterium]